MMPTQEDWQQLLKRLEAVEKLAMELLSGIGKVLEDVLELLVETASRWIKADRDSH